MAPTRTEPGAFGIGQNTKIYTRFRPYPLLSDILGPGGIIDRKRYGLRFAKQDFRQFLEDGEMAEDGYAGLGPVDEDLMYALDHLRLSPAVTFPVPAPPRTFCNMQAGPAGGTPSRFTGILTDDVEMLDVCAEDDDVEMADASPLWCPPLAPAKIATSTALPQASAKASPAGVSVIHSVQPKQALQLYVNISAMAGLQVKLQVTASM